MKEVIESRDFRLETLGLAWTKHELQPLDEAIMGQHDGRSDSTELVATEPQQPLYESIRGLRCKRFTCAVRWICRGRIYFYIGSPSDRPDGVPVPRSGALCRRRNAFFHGFTLSSCLPFLYHNVLYVI